MERNADILQFAVLSLNDQKDARNLARLVLADPLVAKEYWEERLEDTAERDKAILLRYATCYLERDWHSLFS